MFFVLFFYTSVTIFNSEVLNSALVVYTCTLVHFSQWKLSIYNLPSSLVLKELLFWACLFCKLVHCMRCSNFKWWFTVSLLYSVQKSLQHNITIAYFLKNFSVIILFFPMNFLLYFFSCVLGDPSLQWELKNRNKG